MAQSTYNTKLCVKVGAAYKYVADIKDFPDLGGEPEMLETTTLSDKAQTYINGIQSMDALQFTINYDNTTYPVLEKLEDYEEHEFCILFQKGTTNTGAFTWKGQFTVWINGGGVNEVVGATVSISPSTVISVITSVPTVTSYISSTDFT